jgi:hypothetical protein
MPVVVHTVKQCVELVRVALIQTVEKVHFEAGRSGRKLILPAGPVLQLSTCSETDIKCG